MSFDALHVHHAVASFDKQIYLAAMFGKQRWSFDAARGVLIFEGAHAERTELAVQVLGTESDEDASWRWAWAQADSALASRLLTDAQMLRALGEREAIPELRDAETPLRLGFDGATLAAVASGVCRAGCFFRAPYPGGALFLLVRDGHFRRFVTRPLPRIRRIFPMFLSDHRVPDARAHYLPYLAFYRLAVTETANTVEARHGEADPLVATFDAAGQLKALRGGDGAPGGLDVLRPNG